MDKNIFIIIYILFFFFFLIFLGLINYLVKKHAKKIFQREQVQKIHEIIRKSININEVLKLSCIELVKLFGADRAVILKYVPEEDEKIIFKSHCRASEDVPDVTKIYMSDEVKNYIVFLLKENKPIIINDIKELDVPGQVREVFNQAMTKSVMAIPLSLGCNLWGFVLIYQTKHLRTWHEDEISLIKLIAEELYCVIKLSELYTDLKLKSRTESSLRKISSLLVPEITDLKEVLDNICKELLELFHVDRVSFVSYPNPKNYSEWMINSECRRSSDVPSIRNIEYPSAAKIFIGNLLLDQDKNIVLENIAESDFPEYFKEIYRELNVKSMLAVPIKKEDSKWGMLGLFQTNYQRKWTKEEISLLHSIVTQIYIAITQAKLYLSVKKKAEKEVLLREITNAMRETLDINEIKKTFVTKIGEFYNVDRLIFVEYDSQRNTYLHIDKHSEYLPKPALESLVGFSPTTPDWMEFIDLLKELKEINFSTFEDYIKENNLENTGIERIFRHCSVKSGFNIFIIYGEKFLGFFCIDFIKKNYKIKDEDHDFLKTLSNQFAIAFYQAKLYEKQKQNAEKECLLRELVSKLKISENAETAYTYLVAKLISIYNADLVFFIKILSSKYEKSQIYYEFKRKEDDTKTLKDIEIQTYCPNLISELITLLKPIIIDDTSNYHEKNKQEQEFYQKYNIKSLLAIPLVRYNDKIKILGIIFICSDKLKTWSEYEVNLLKSIAESSVTVLWEIIKRAEMDTLRDTFILALAHDLQIPIIGECKAIEYLASRPADSSLGDYKHLFEDILKSNENLLTILFKLLDSYNYESGKKKLSLSKYDLPSIIKEVVNAQNELIQSKSMTVELNIQEDLPEIKIDISEIKKIIENILKNALVYTQVNGYIEISCFIREKNIITSISDNGPGILPAIREKIFERYAMAVTLERKIGSGLGLYLSKQIVQAHKGSIWYITEPEKGTTFYFSLPLEELNPSNNN